MIPRARAVALPRHSSPAGPGHVPSTTAAQLACAAVVVHSRPRELFAFPRRFATLPGMKATAALAALFTMLMAETRSGCAPASRPLSIETTSVPLAANADTVRVGKLLYRGGLQMDSGEAAFGGLSAIVVSADGSRFVAVTDESHWILGRLTYEDGNLSGATGERIAPLLAPDASPVRDKPTALRGKPTALRGKDGDAEGLAATSAGLDGDLFVSFEGDHRLWRYAFGRDGVLAVPTGMPLPADARSASPNEGIEGLTLLRDGRLLAMSERFRDEARRFRAWLMPAQHVDGNVANASATEIAEPLALAPLEPFSLTDVRQLDNGDLLTLERRYHPGSGVGMQMRRIPASLVHGGAVLDGEVVAELGAGFTIDNMEGLSVRRGESGETLVYVVSDDNFNAPAQRTLLMMFELED